MNREKFPSTTIDEINWRILDELQRNAKISYRALSDKIHMSVSTIAERIRKMEEDGVIEGYRTIVNPQKAGFAFSALLHFSVNCGNPDENMHLQNTFAAIPEIASIWSITGSSDYLLEINVPSLNFLQDILVLLTKYGKITTSIVLPESNKKMILHPPRSTLLEHN